MAIWPNIKPFRVGQRVRPSKHGIEHCLFARTKHDQSGVVTKVDKWNCPTVLWDGRKTATTYAAPFIDPDRRRNRHTTKDKSYG